MDAIETPRLLLRDFVLDDWKAVHEYAGDPEVSKYMLWGPNSADQTLEFVRKLLEEQRRPNRRAFELATILRGPEERLIGGCRITVGAERKFEADLGYVLHRKFWGAGYATEATRALITAGFRSLGLHRIFATCDVRNAASARVLEKAGMKREGHLRQNLFVKGDWRDSYLYAILYPEWKEQREAGLFP